MSLRTKILAAVVGLNVLVLVLGVVVLLFGFPRSPGVPGDLLRRLVDLAGGTEPGAEGRRTRVREFAELAAQPGVECAIWLEEGADDRRTPQPVAYREDRPAPAAADVDRARVLHRLARTEGQAQVLGREALVLIDAGPDPEDPTPHASRRQSAYVRWSETDAEIGRVRVLYFTLLGGMGVLTGVAWTLLSRLVVRPLASLAGAAARVAGGDLTARVPATGAGDEFDRTAQAFNRMAAEIAEHQSHLEDRVMQALTRVRKAEQHLAIAQRLAATGKLASGIAHEINNPLGGMRNAVRALQRGDLDEAKTTQYLELVQDGLARVEDTVKKVLSFTPRSANPKPTDLAEVARNAVALARHRVERRGLRLVERMPEDERVAVFGDPHELQQVALNLLLNAVDAIPDRDEAGNPRPPDHGRIEIEVRAEGEWAVLSVSDDGIGMTPEVQAQCFDLFFTTKPVGEGTGLGLAVVHNIVTNHGGRIDVESAPGRGATFRIHLPRESVAGDVGPSAARGAVPSAGASPRGGGAA